VAEVLGKPLVFNPALFEQISDFFTRMGRTASPNNRKQAFIPEGAIPIENPVGTAPGFISEQDGKAIIIVPGVPHEMINIFLLTCVALGILTLKKGKQYKTARS